MKKGLLALIILASILGSYLYIKQRQTSKTEAIPKTLIVGTTADFKPFACIQDGTIVGFDIDIVYEVAKRLGVEAIIKDMPFAMLIPQLQLGNIQVIAAGMTPTKERAKRVLFTKPFLRGDKLIALTKIENPLQNIDDLAGKNVVVNEGYTADRYMSAIKGMTIIRLPTVADALLALKSGRADAFVSALHCLEPFFKQYGKGTFNFFPLKGTQEDVALAIAPQYQRLASRIQEILDEMERDGTIALLKKNWQLS